MLRPSFLTGAGMSRTRWGLYPGQTFIRRNPLWMLSAHRQASAWKLSLKPPQPAYAVRSELTVNGPPSSSAILLEISAFASPRSHSGSDQIAVSRYDVWLASL